MTEQSRAVYNERKTVSEAEETVQDKECKQVEEQVCRNVPKMEYQDVPEVVERQVLHEACWGEAEESRHDAPREVCHQVPQEEKKKPKTKKVDKTSWDCEIFNESKPILTRKPDEIEQGEYDEFYQSITKDKSGPMTPTHSIAKGGVGFRSLIFVPNSQPSEQFNKFGQAAENVKLYVGGVFITDDFKDMIPSYLSFDKGVVDSDDKYGAFWAEYSTNIKLGVIEDTANRTRLARWLRFTSSNGKLSSLAEYVERMKDIQESIFYMAGGSREEVEKSPFVQRLLKKGYEVLYLTEGVDEYAISVQPEFEEREFQNVAKEGSSIDGDTDNSQKNEVKHEEEPKEGMDDDTRALAPIEEKLEETERSENSDDQEMKNQVGPATKEIETVDKAEAILAETDVVIFAPGAADNPPDVQHAAAQNMDGENHIHPHSSSHSSVMNLFPSRSSSKVMTTMYPDTTDSPGNHLQLTPWTLDSSHLSAITLTCVTLAKLCEEAICNQDSIASETYYEEMAYEEREDDKVDEETVDDKHSNDKTAGPVSNDDPGFVPSDASANSDDRNSRDDKTLPLGGWKMKNQMPNVKMKPIDCNLCDQVSKWKMSLSLHIERNHEGKDFSLEIINPGIVPGDVPHSEDGPGDVPDEVPHPGDVPGDERAEHQLVQGDAPAAAPQLHKGSPNTIQPLTKMRVLPRYPEFHDKPTLDQILTLNLPGQVMDERQNEQAVLSMPQDSDVHKEVEEKQLSTG